MLNKEISRLLNEQVNKELYSAYLYLDMSNYYNLNSLNGFSNWFKIQAQEERDHAMLFMTYLQDNGEPIKLTAIAEPDIKFNAFRDPLEAALEHEKFVTASINNIYDKANQDKDFKTLQFLNWFITEQLEEERNAGELVDRYDLFGNTDNGLYMLDKEMEARTYETPSLVMD